MPKASPAAISAATPASTSSATIPSPCSPTSPTAPPSPTTSSGPSRSSVVDLNAHALPAFTFIVPDVDDDAHNGTPQQADSWLQTNVVTPLSADPAFQAGGDGVLIIDFDEAATSDTTHGGGHVPAVFWGPGVQAGYQQTSSTVYQHESMLATIMELLNLPNPPGNAANAPLMNEFFVQ